MPHVADTHNNEVMFKREAKEHCWRQCVRKLCPKMFGYSIYVHIIQGIRPYTMLLWFYTLVLA